MGEDIRRYQDMPLETLAAHYTDAAYKAAGPDPLKTDIYQVGYLLRPWMRVFEAPLHLSKPPQYNALPVAAKEAVAEVSTNCRDLFANSILYDSSYRLEFYVHPNDRRPTVSEYSDAEIISVVGVALQRAADIEPPESIRQEAFDEDLRYASKRKNLGKEMFPQLEGLSYASRLMARELIKAAGAYIQPMVAGCRLLFKDDTNDYEDFIQETATHIKSPWKNPRWVSGDSELA